MFRTKLKETKGPEYKNGSLCRYSFIGSEK